MLEFGFTFLRAFIAANLSVCFAFSGYLFTTIYTKRALLLSRLSASRTTICLVFTSFNKPLTTSRADSAILVDVVSQVLIYNVAVYRPERPLLAVALFRE